MAKTLGGAPVEAASAEFDAFLANVSLSIARELDVWWFSMHRLAVQGCFGDLGKKLGWQLWPHERANPLG